MDFCPASFSILLTWTLKIQLARISKPKSRRYQKSSLRFSALNIGQKKGFMDY
jgi:hypothetical protein